MYIYDSSFYYNKIPTYGIYISYINVITSMYRFVNQINPVFNFYSLFI